MGNSPIDIFWKGTEYNNAEKLGVTIKRVEKTPEGTAYAHCIVVHHLTKDQNRGNHNLYMDVIDESGKRIKGAMVRGDNNGIKLMARIDKPDNEFGTNFSMYSQDTLSCWVDDVPGIGKVPSDTVSGFHTRWGGEIAQHNDYGHNSYYVIWQLRKGSGVVPEPPPKPIPKPPPPGPEPIPDPDGDYREGFKDGLRFVLEQVTQTLNKL